MRRTVNRQTESIEALGGPTCAFRGNRPVAGDEREGGQPRLGGHAADSVVGLRDQLLVQERLAVALETESEAAALARARLGNQPSGRIDG
jgi:hypothetical protein